MQGETTARFMSRLLYITHTARDMNLIYQASQVLPSPITLRH